MFVINNYFVHSNAGLYKGTILIITVIRNHVIEPQALTYGIYEDYIKLIARIDLVPSVTALSFLVRLGQFLRQ